MNPCTRAAELLLPDESYQNLAVISLSDSTVKLRIAEMTEDIKTQVVEKVKSSPVFAVQCDEATDVAQCSQLLFYTRCLWKEPVEEETFCCPLETSTTAADIFKAVSIFFFFPQEHDKSWKK